MKKTNTIIGLLTIVVITFFIVQNAVINISLSEMIDLSALNKEQLEKISKNEDREYRLFAVENAIKFHDENVYSLRKDLFLVKQLNAIIIIISLIVVVFLLYKVNKLIRHINTSN